MGTLNISKVQLKNQDGELQPVLQVGTTKDLTTSTSTANTAVPTGSEELVRFLADEDMYVKFGTSGSVEAAAGDYRLSAGVPEVLFIPSATTHIAAIDVA